MGDTARGYGKEHDRLRRNWAPQVAKGNVNCSRCSQPIAPDADWHLDHNDDRTGYRGPSHALCNVIAGGQASALARAAHPRKRPVPQHPSLAKQDTT